MLRRILAFFYGCLLAATPALAKATPALAKRIELTSPDGNIHFSFQAADSGLYYSVAFRKTRIIDRSPLGLSFQGKGDFGKNCLYHPPIYREGEDKYELVVGKTSSVHDFYREVEIPLEERAGQHRRINILVRLFNDGLAFRYLLPQQADWSSYNLTDENTCFRVAGDPVLLASFLPGYTTSHEGRYTRIPFSKIRNDTLMDLPVFMEFEGAGRIYVAVTEAELVDYAGMYLVRHGDCLKSELSPLPEHATQQETGPSSGQAPTGPSAQVPDRSSIKVRAALPHRTPWRVLLIGDRPGALIESNILTSLNEPCAIKDVSWIRPGKTDFHWWNGDIVPDTTFSPGINFETNQYYIDFCARNRLAYHTIIGFGGMAWYTNDGISYAPGPHSDVTRPIPGLDMKQLSDYAEKKGVGIRVWVHWKALYPMIDKAFQQFEKWGIRGMMVDFMDRDDQEMVNIQTEILQKAALHHLHIQFHGAYKPTGLSRTYPNEFTREGTLNYENDKWDNPITPEDDINVVFTRLLAGATDYHLGGFRAVPAAEYRPQFTRPLVLGTRCHMLAMYVILESYLGMVCDYPAAYEGQKGFDFIRTVPTTWDETRVPEAVPGGWATIARRKGEEWYVGTINNSTPRQVTIPLNFLSPGQYQLTIYRDADDAAAQPDHLIVETRTVQASDTLTVSLAPGGGQVMRIKKIPPVHHYLYVAEPGIRNYLQYGGHGLLVFDMDNDFSFVRRIATGGLDDKGQPSNVKGIAVSLYTHCIYVSTIQSLQCLDLLTDRLVWEKKYEGGCDRMSVSTDGKTIYLPSFEGDDWKVVDAVTGEVRGRVVTHSGSHNTIYGPDGKKVYLEGLRSDYLTVVNADNTDSTTQVGPFANHVRPFTINSAQTRCYINADSLLGFEIGDLTSGKKIAHVEVKGYHMGPVKRHGCPSHGIALTPDESELWLADGFNESIHIFDIRNKDIRQTASIKLSDQPGWITFSLDGKYAMPSTGEIIDIPNKKIITSLVDETGTRVQSEKMVEVQFAGKDPVKAGDQFAIGRAGQAGTSGARPATGTFKPGPAQ